MASEIDCLRMTTLQEEIKLTTTIEPQNATNKQTIWSSNNPAVAIVKDGADIGEAELTCQLMDGKYPLETPVKMIFEPKTEEEPAHFAGAKLTFPPKDKTYLVKFEIKIDGTEETFSDTIEVLCGHQISSTRTDKANGPRECF